MDTLTAPRSTRSRVTWFAVAAALAVLAAFVIFIKSGNEEVGGCGLEGFSCYPLNVGYEPGTIVAVAPDGSLSASLLSRSDLLSIDSIRLRLTPESSIPALEIVRRASFSGLVSGESTLTTVNATVKTELAAVRSATQRVQQGRKYGLEQGVVSFLTVLAELPPSTISGLLDRASRGDSLVAVIEVLRYDDATVTLEWNERLGTEAKSVLTTALRANAGLTWQDDDKVVIQYREPILVGYRSEHIALSVLESARLSASQPVWYRDADSDSYGDLRHSRRSATAPQCYVSNSRDCYDGNKDARPDQTVWFATNRGDGSFDYNCDGKDELQSEVFGRCVSGRGSAQPRGWSGAIPACGRKGTWLDDCDRTVTRTIAEYQERTQSCH
jgi:hypothetical protein